MMDPMKIYQVNWTDSNSSAGWHASEVQNYKPMHCVTVGFLIEEKETHVSLSPSLAFEAEADVCDVMTIPRCNIFQMIEVGEYEPPAS